MRKIKDLNDKIIDLVDYMITQSLPEYLCSLYFLYIEIYIGSIDNLYIKDIIFHRKRKEIECIIFSDNSGFN